MENPACSGQRPRVWSLRASRVPPGTLGPEEMPRETREFNEPLRSVGTGRGGQAAFRVGPAGHRQGQLPLPHGPLAANGKAPERRERWQEWLSGEQQLARASSLWEDVEREETAKLRDGWGPSAAFGGASWADMGRPPRAASTPQ